MAQFLIDSTTTTDISSTYTLGTRIRVDKNTVITKFGIKASVMASNVVLAIWNASTQTKVWSAAANSISIVNGWNWYNVPSITLLAGTDYYLTEYSPSSNITQYMVNGLTPGNYYSSTAGGVTFSYRSAYDYASGDAYPSTSGASATYTFCYGLEFSSNTRIGTHKVCDVTGANLSLPIYSVASGTPNGSTAHRIQISAGLGAFDLVPATSPLASGWMVQTSGGTKSVAVDAAYTNDWSVNPTSYQTTTFNSNAGGIMNITSTSTDPFFNMYSLGSWDPNKYRYIQIRYRLISGTTDFQIFFCNTTYTSANGAAVLNSPSVLISDAQWHIATIDMWNHAGWKTGGNITGWRYDWATNTGVNMELDWIRLVA